jgi:anti-sigma B factor antagonist
MPETANKPVFLVDANSEPVVVQIQGRACFQNSPCLRDFFTEMVARGKKSFVIDFAHCASMDSTFLGVVAGLALELKKTVPGASLVATRMGPRNLELVRSLGLHRLLIVDPGDAPAAPNAGATALECAHHTELENARIVLEAHENLVAADEGNRAKFQDVLAFLKNRVEQK